MRIFKEANGRNRAYLAILLSANQSLVHAQDFEVFTHERTLKAPLVAVADYPAPGLQVLIDDREKLRLSSGERLFEAEVALAEERYALPSHLLKALIWAETRFRPSAVSPAGAIGIAQLMPATARELHVRNPLDPIESIDGGARYLRRMLDQFGRIDLALSAYNAGPGAVARAGGIPRNRETLKYVSSVLRRWMAYRSQ